MIVWSKNWAQAPFSTRKRRTAFPSLSLPRGSKPGKCVFAGGCGPSQGGLPGVAGLGLGGKPPFLRSARWKARSLSTRLAFRSQGVATWRGSPRHETPTAMPGHAFGRGGVATGGRSRDDRPFVGRGLPVRGSLLLRQRRRSRCEGPAWRAVGRNVPPFFRAGAFTGSEGVGSASLAGSALAV
jgi:hypothetical protein